jgi:hypothetical protein
LLATPVSKEIDPESPRLVVPDLTTICPEIPVTPAFEVETKIEPDEVDVPAPLFRLRFPPYPE